MRNPKRGCRENVRVTDQEWPEGFVRRHMVRSTSREGSEHGPYRKFRLKIRKTRQEPGRRDAYYSFMSRRGASGPADVHD